MGCYSELMPHASQTPGHFAKKDLETLDMSSKPPETAEKILLSDEAIKIFPNIPPDDYCGVVFVDVVVYDSGKQLFQV